MAVWAQLCQQQQLYSAKSNTPPDFPSPCQTESHHRETSQGRGPTGLNPSSQSSDSTGKVTGITINHGEFWKTAKMLTYQCNYLSMFSIDSFFFTIVFRKSSFPIISKAHPSHLPWYFSWKKTCFLVYSGQNSWIADLSLTPQAQESLSPFSQIPDTCQWMGLAGAAQANPQGTPWNYTLLQWPYFPQKPDEKSAGAMGGTIVLATGLKVPAWKLSFTPCLETEPNTALSTETEIT